MITGDNGKLSYEFGWAQGDARRRNTRPTVGVPSNIDTFWFDLGDTDGAMGRGKRDFSGASQAASTDEERLVYDDGFYGNAAPRFDGYSPWFEAGKQDRAAGRPRLWVLRSGAAGPAPRTAPPYRPLPNPNAAPLPPVVVNAPPVGGNPASYPVPVQRGPVAPWEWQSSPFGGGNGGSGIILYGPGYYFDLSKMIPVNKANNQPRF